MGSEQLASMSLVPYRIDRGCAHFFVSKCDSDDFPGQVHDALAFLSVKKSDVVSLMRSEGATGVLDFAVEAQTDGFQFWVFPPALVAQAGSIGLALEISLYSTEVS